MNYFLSRTGVIAMLRGWSKFVCNECGHKFVGMDLQEICCKTIAE